MLWAESLESCSISSRQGASGAPAAEGAPPRGLSHWQEDTVPFSITSNGSLNGQICCFAVHLVLQLPELLSPAGRRPPACVHAVGLWRVCLGSDRPGRWFWAEASVSDPAEMVLKTCPANKHPFRHLRTQGHVRSAPRCAPRRRRPSDCPPQTASCSSSCSPWSTG